MNNQSEIEQKEPIVVGFFNPQHAKSRMLDLYYNFFVKHCDVVKFEQPEMDTLQPILHYPSTTRMIVPDQQWKTSATLFAK